MSERPGASLADELASMLLAARNPDGGWPYYKGKASRLEPTCAALLALALGSSPLESWPRREGLFVDAANEINIAFNGLAGVLLGASPGPPISRDLVRALLETRGVRLPPGSINRQDDSIQAWPWTAGTFSWVESTCWCLIALKRLTSAPRTPQVLRRINDGERLLADRVCHDGGWNHGNSNMLGTELAPHVPTTALGLLSLHDRLSAPHVARSLSYLEAHQRAESGGMALALAAICLDVYDRPREAALDALAAEWHRSRFLDNLFAIALSLYAVTSPRHRCEAFRV